MTTFYASQLDDEFGHAKLNGVSSDAQTLNHIISWVADQGGGHNTLMLDVPKLMLTGQVDVESNITINAGTGASATIIHKAFDAGSDAVISQDNLDQRIRDFHWVGGHFKNEMLSSDGKHGFGGDLFSLFGDNCSITEVLMHTTNDVVEHTSHDADPRQSGRIVNFGGNNWTIENNEFFGGLGGVGAGGVHGYGGENIKVNFNTIQSDDDNITFFPNLNSPRLDNMDLFNVQVMGNELLAASGKNINFSIDPEGSDLEASLASMDTIVIRDNFGQVGLSKSQDTGNNAIKVVNTTGDFIRDVRILDNEFDMSFSSADRAVSLGTTVFADEGGPIHYARVSDVEIHGLTIDNPYKDEIEAVRTIINESSRTLTEKQQALFVEDVSIRDTRIGDADLDNARSVRGYFNGLSFGPGIELEDQVGLDMARNVNGVEDIFF